MAEALISVLLEKLASVTYQYVEEEVKLVLNAEKDVQEFEANLKAISAVLADAELRQVKEASVRNWLEELKDVSYKMDNVLDEWNTEILKQQVEKQEEQGGTTSLVTDKKKRAVCFSIPSSCFCFGQVSRVIRHGEIASKIKSLNENLDVIAERRQAYNFQFMERIIIEQPEREKTSSFVDQSIVFGREQQKEVLVSKLLNESSQEERGLLVIPIVGMGGMGKTTLAQLAFNDENVKACFHIKIWVCVSDPFDEIKIAKAIIEGVEKDTSPNSNELELVFQCMSKSIEGNKFLLVLDDVWTEDERKWEKLKLPLKQSGARGSRILVTTRKQDVADMMGAPTHTIYLERLSEQNCLSIFNCMAFFSRDKDSVLEGIGEKIVKKCKGLPLAAKTLGSLMRYKKTGKEWQEVLDNKIWELEKFEQQVFQPLLLSYLDLAPAVKQCLLYCAIFPKDHLIDKDYLIELWMSQEYLYSKEKIEKKIIGQRCFDNLVMRSFFQDFEKDQDGNIEKCKMHDIVHDFLQFITQNECFTMEVKGGNDTIESLGDKIRHLTLLLAPEGPFPCVSFSSCKTNLRTLATFGSKITVVDSTLMSQLKHLRTLNLSSNCFKELSEEIGELVHLRFIDLSGNYKLKKLPNGVCNLYNLQTLRLDRCGELESLPQSMGKLINLKHLYVDYCFQLYLPKGIGRLKNLRGLDRCPVGVVDDDEAFKLGDLRNLNQLQGRLSIVIYREVKVAAGEGGKILPLGNKQKLSQLIIRFVGCGRSAETLNFLRPHPNLESLFIRGYNGSTAPNWVMSVNNLRFLRLEHWNECEVLPTLGKLPFLETLMLEGMEGVEKVGVEFLGIEKETSSASSCIIFPKLKTLTFDAMSAWKEWNGVEEWKEKDSDITIMPCLSSLLIEHCDQLKTLPDFLGKTPLQTLNIRDCDSLAQGCRRGRGKEWISHIPNIKITGRIPFLADHEGDVIF